MKDKVKEIHQSLGMNIEGLEQLREQLEEAGDISLVKPSTIDMIDEFGEYIRNCSWHLKREFIISQEEKPTSKPKSPDGE